MACIVDMSGSRLSERSLRTSIRSNGHRLLSDAAADIPTYLRLGLFQHFNFPPILRLKAMNPAANRLFGDRQPSCLLVRNYFRPPRQEFSTRTLWSLCNPSPVRLKNSIPFRNSKPQPSLGSFSRKDRGALPQWRCAPRLLLSGGAFLQS